MEGNQQKMREALDNIGNAAAWIAENCNDQQTAKYMNDMIAIVLTALAEPPRNCDVGTAKEQEERFKHFCASNYSACDVDMECCRCPLEFEKARCEFAWAQMPYAEEGAEK